MIFLCQWWRVTRRLGDEVELGRVLTYPFRWSMLLVVGEEPLSWNSGDLFSGLSSAPKSWTTAWRQWDVVRCRIYLKAEPTTIAGRLDVGSEGNRGSKISLECLAEQMDGHLLRRGRQWGKQILGRWSKGLTCEWVTSSYSWLTLNTSTLP